MNLLDLMVKIGVDDQASGKIGGIGSKITSGLATAAKAGVAAVGAAGAAVVALGTQAVSAYADYEQLVGGMDTLFKNSSQQMQQYAANAYQTAGVSANRYMEISTSFAASLINSLGGDTAAAAEMANSAVIAMSDNANKMGTSLETVQEAYMSLSRGNYEMLDSLKLGYGGTKAELERLLSDAEKLAAKNGEVRDFSVDSFADIVEAIQLVQDEMGITGTTAAEASETISGSINQAKSAWENWIAGLGNEDADMGKLTDQLVDSVGTVIDNVIPRIGQIGGALVETIAEKAPEAMEELQGKLADGAQQAVDTAVSIIEDSFDVELPDIDVSRVTDGFDRILDSVESIRDSIDWDAVFSGLESAWDGIEPVAEAIVDVFEDNIAPAIESVGEQFGPLVEAIGEFIEAISPVAEFIATGVGQWVGIFLEGISQIIGFITDIINAITDFVNFITGIPEGVANAINGIVQAFQQLPGRIAEVISNIIGQLGQFAASMGQQALQAGAQFLSSLGQKLNEAVQFVAGVPGRILSALGNIGSTLFSAGQQLIQGFINGIASMVRGVIDTVGGVVNDAIQAAKNLLGIASPSKVFREIGMFTGEGFIDGIDKIGPKVRKAMDGFASDVTFGTDGLIPAAGMGAAVGGGVTNNYYIGDTMVSRTSEEQFAEDFIKLMDDFGRLART